MYARMGAFGPYAEANAELAGSSEVAGAAPPFFNLFTCTKSTITAIANAIVSPIESLLIMF